MLPPLPHNRAFDIPQEFADLILADSGPDDPERIIMFGDRVLATHLNTDLWLCDGTFKCCPDLFFQLYTIHAKVKSTIIFF